MGRIVQPVGAAGAAGFYSAAGSFTKGLEGTINVPEAALNIGGNGYGFRLEAQNNLDPLGTGRNDSSFSELTLGQDYYLYGCRPTIGGRIAYPIFSINSTYPDGFDANLSRKVSGFHVGRIRTMAQRFDAGAALSTGILPNSVWDLCNRPVGQIVPGMVKVGSFWVFIYLASEDGTPWPNTIPLSKYNAVPLTGTEGYSFFDYQRLARNIDWRLPTYPEYQDYAYGVPEGSVGGSARANTGSSGVFISCENVDQPSGNLWQVLNEYFAKTGGSWGWGEYDQGKDSAYGHGSIYHNDSDLRQMLVGCDWGSGLIGGSRSASLSTAPWGVSYVVGVRFLSPSMKICNL